MDASKKSQIRNLLIIFGGGVVMALLFAAIMLYQYNPSDRYEIKNILIAPSSLASLKYNEKSSRYIFDKIDFQYDDLEKGEKEKVVVSAADYQVFYDKIFGLKSEIAVSDEIKNLFNKGHPARLKIWVKTENNGALSTTTKIFQEIEFASQSGYFRVRLREADSGITYRYAYFHNPEIYKWALELWKK